MCIGMLLIAIASYGQGATATIIKHVSNGEVAEAKELVDAHWEVDSVANQAKFWYFSGYVYQELYKQSKENDSAALHLGNKALEALKQSTKTTGSEGFLSNAQRLMDYLVGRYYNAAMSNVGNQQYELAQAFFKQYESYKPIASPGYDLKKAQVKFYKALAIAYAEQAKGHKATKGVVDQTLVLKAIEANQRVLELNAESYFALYNVGLLYYTLALAATTEAKAYALQAESYWKKAETVDQGTTAAESLLRLYKQTGMDEKAAAYQQKLGN